MTRPADITLLDEIRSIQMMVHLEFPTDKIKIERPQEDEKYDILIEPPSEIISTAVGTYMSDETMPLVVQKWCSTYISAVDAVEKLKMLFIKGVAQGRPRRIPVWKHDVTPDPLTTPPDRFLKIEDLETRILPAQTIGQYVAILEMRTRGWRITFAHTDQTVDHVARPGADLG